MTTELYEKEQLFVEKIIRDKAKLEEENKQIKKQIKKYINSSDFVYDELYIKREKIKKILRDQESESE